ncbi:MAG TPA: MTH938/NDUFAF3 family protein [Syntrophales bacterium]|nr:MTH938/NDUFAF3 family protein [Syntrophales bacterium]
MKPDISDTGFGYITIEGSKIEYDIVIRLSGKIKKRKKKLSKAVYGTSHTISLEEVKHIYQDGAERLIIGSGQEGMVRLSEEAADYLKKKKCKVTLQPTPKAIEYWNKAKGAVISLFHVTC